MERDLRVAAAAKSKVAPDQTERYGVVIGIDRYADPRLTLRCAEADALALHALMVDPQCGMFSAKNVVLLTNELATRANIWKALVDVSRKARRQDVVWIFYAGHAAHEEDSTFWVTQDSDVDNLLATALDRVDIARILGRIASTRVLVLLDCCYAAATATRKNAVRSMPDPRSHLAGFEGEGMITMAASDGAHKSVELTNVGHGAFTHFLTLGLRGAADVNGDGVVTADELWDYLRDRVEDASRAAGNLQRPVLIATMTHDVPLTLSASSFGGEGLLSGNAPVAPFPEQVLHQDTQVIASRRRDVRTYGPVVALSVLGGAALFFGLRALGRPPEHGPAPRDAQPGCATSITVRGRVVDTLSRGVPDAHVALRHDARALQDAGDPPFKYLTDEAGAFSIANVCPPYDLSLDYMGARSGIPAREIWTYQGLTRSDPHLQVMAVCQRGTWVDVTLEKSSSRGQPRVRHAVAFGARQQPSKSFQLGSGQFAMSRMYEWQGDLALHGTAHALQWIDNGDGEPLEFTRYGEREVTFAQGIHTVLQYKELSATPTTGTLTVRMQSRQAVLARVSVDLQFPSGVLMRLYDDREVTLSGDEQGADALDLAIPMAEGWRARVGVKTETSYSAADGIDLNPATTRHRTAEIVVRRPVQLLTPLHGDRWTQDTAFSWQLPAGEVEEARAVVVCKTASESSNSVLDECLATSAAHSAFPSRVAPTAPAKLVWWVVQFGRHQTVDELAGPGGLRFPEDTCWNLASPTDGDRTASSRRTLVP